MMKQTQPDTKCLTQADCKRIIIKKCLRGNQKACQVVIKGVKHERRL